MLSVSVLGISTAFCVKAGYGTNSIATLFDGISKITKIKLGVVANTINTTLSLLIFSKNRKYINIGTVVYATIMGTFIGLGLKLYNSLNIPNVFYAKVFMSLVGCFLYFVSLAALPRRGLVLTLGLLSLL